MVEWLIIGGGIQGMTIATYLRKKKKIASTNIMIVDPHSSPLSMWKRCTSNIGMTYLRSPSIHHLDPEPFALEKFAKSIPGKEKNIFTAPYDRPGLHLFNSHCDCLFKEWNLLNSWNKGRVSNIKKIKENWRILLEDGQQIDARNIVLAIGLSEQLNWPSWATDLKKQGAAIYHVFENDQADRKNEKTLIVGGGISGAHTALTTSLEQPGKVTLVTRHEIKVHQFDSNPSWLGPKKMSSFLSTSSYAKRREWIQAARHRGSMPSELKVRLNQAVSRLELELAVSNISEVNWDHGFFSIRGTSGFEWKGDSILLASGFQTNAPAMDWLQSLVKEEKLPCSNCGYPIPTDQSLEWAPRLYVLGALAELSVGPVSRNISGARRGAERIISSIR